MTASRNTVAIIPARGGSKGIPQKNIVSLAGKPLIAYSIEAAQEAQVVDRIIVSTDCAEITGIVMKYAGVEIHHREVALAMDNSPTIEVVLDVINVNQLEGRVILLQPTSPMRTGAMVDEAFIHFERGGHASLISICEQETAYKSFLMEDGLLSPLFKVKHLSMPRQKLPKTFRQNGAIYIIDIDTLQQHRSFFVPPCAGYLMSAQSSLDIDTPSDLKLAEAIIKETR